MARKDAIEVEGTVVELLPNTMFRGRDSRWASHAGTHFRQNVSALHSDLARRQSYARDFTLEICRKGELFIAKDDDPAGGRGFRFSEL
jgi:hypothetical protein